MPEIICNYQLKHLNTFKIECLTSQYCIVRNERDIFELYESNVFNNQPVLILGGGSNILFTRNFDGLVVHIQLKGVEFKKISRQYTQVCASAGEIWDNLVKLTVDRNLWGFENLSGIPGTVGAAPVQNIGAYGVEIMNCIDKVHFIYLDTGVKSSFSRSACEFGYRQSIFKNQLKNKVLITSVDFKLSNLPAPVLNYSNLAELSKLDSITPLYVRKMVSEIRASKLPDPEITGNAGSFFKNPVVPKSTAEALKAEYGNIVTFPVDDNHEKLAAGWLIEHCGLKGYTLPGGRAGVHSKQALVLVNYGNASGIEILQLADYIIEKVKEKFNVQLEPEVNIV